MFLANVWVFWALFPLSMNPLEPSGAPERSSRAEHCGESRENLMKVLLVALHSRHFQEFLGDLCDHFIVTKRGVSNQECCPFMKIISCRNKKKIRFPSPVKHKFVITKKQVSSQIDHPSHIMCAFLVCLYECVCVCCVCCVCLCVVYNLMFVCIHICVYVCVYIYMRVYMYI